MLPTKGYFQAIECPYYNSSCGRPYCHFRHKKKTDIVEELVVEPENEENAAIPIYKPTPKSELANIHNNKSHIPISYVPDLAFRRERRARPVAKFEKPTYNPTPLSILSSASKHSSSVGEENGENLEAIKEIKQNIANMEYDPATSLQPSEDIDFEGLDSEFAIIDEIIRSTSFKKKKFNLTSNIKETSQDLKTESDVSHPSEDSLKDDSELINKRDISTEIVVENKSDIDETDKQKSKKQKTLKQNSSKSDNSDEKKKENKSERREKTVDSKKDNVRNKTENIENKVKKQVHTEKLVDTLKESSHKSKKLNKSKSSKIDKKDREKSPEKSVQKSEKSHKSSSRDKHRKEDHKDRKNKSKDRDRSDRNTEKYDNKNKNVEKKIKENSDVKYQKKESSSERTKSKDEMNEKSKCKHQKKEKEQNKDGSMEKRKNKIFDEDRRKRKEHEDYPKNKDKHRESREKSNSKLKHRSSKSDKSNNKSEKFSAKVKRRSENVSSSDESLSDRDNSVQNYEPIENDLVDLDIDDEDQTMLECYKIFNEYKPPLKHTESSTDSEMFSPEHSSRDSTDLVPNKVVGKQRIAHASVERTYSQLHPPEKPKSISTPGQTLTNRYKLAKMAQANREQELLMNEVQHSAPIKRAAPTLLEAARARKIRKESSTVNHINTNVVDDILQGSSNKIVPPPRPKIAPAQNVSLMAKAKERLSKMAQLPPKTVAHTQKAPRVAHVPDVSLSDIPDVLQADKSKLPVNVRTRFLTMLADECVKLYISKEEAFSRALNEEYACYEKCNVLATYRNSAMLAVNRMRKEIQERNASGLGLIGVGEYEAKGPDGEFKSSSFYNKISSWILSEEELDIHGFPRDSDEHHGKVIIKNQRFRPSSNLDENQRMCCRCQKVYLVDDDGWPLYDEECLYHPLKKRTIRGEQTYLCCRSSDETGCATSDTHVSEGFSSAELEGYQTTMESESDDDPRSTAVYALDCEMCYTTKGLELTRVTVVDADCKTVYESLVKPLNPIIDYNTRFSGITKEQMDRTSTSILQVQANILHLCNSKTILVGHSLESDMKALKIVHGTIIDTSVLFPHKMGLPHKRALRALASEYLRKIIQNNISGHDSAEDAVTCMELLKWKLKEESKSRK